MQTNLLSRKTSATSAPAGPQPKKKGVRGPVFLVVAGLIVLFLIIAGIKGLQFFTMIKAGKSMAPPPTTVTSATVQKGDWEPVLTAVGSISPVQGATISAELAGRVSEIGFESGKPVKQGDLLIKLDASAEQAQLHDDEIAASRRNLAEVLGDGARESGGRHDEIVATTSGMAELKRSNRSKPVFD